MGNSNSGNYNQLPTYEMHTTNNTHNVYGATYNDSIQQPDNVRRFPQINLDGDIELSEKNGLRFCGVLSIFMFVLIMIVSSLNFVAYNEYGLARNRLGSVYSTPVYSQGTYLLFPIYTLEKFPAVNTEVHFNSSVFSDTGLEFDMEIQFYYYFPEKNVYKIYNEFSLSYNSIIDSRSKKTIKNLASLFSVTQFLQNRTGIEKTLANGVYNDLYDNIGVIAPKEYFKITNILFPANIIANSLNSAIAIQNIELQTNQQNVQVVVADTQLMVSRITANTTEVLQNSVSDSTKIKATADNFYQNIVNSARSKGIQNVINKINIPTNLVNDFVQVMALYDNLNRTIINNVGGNVLINNN